MEYEDISLSLQEALRNAPNFEAILKLVQEEKDRRAWAKFESEASSIRATNAEDSGEPPELEAAETSPADLMDPGPVPINQINLAVESVVQENDVLNSDPNMDLDFALDNDLGVDEVTAFHGLFPKEAREDVHENLKSDKELPYQDRNHRVILPSSDTGFLSKQGLSMTNTSATTVATVIDYIAAFDALLCNSRNQPIDDPEGLLKHQDYPRAESSQLHHHERTVFIQSFR
ncbi:hypothetical protein MMC25_006029 [Agyrium rufum]|nr:hypothetical protein [Agyrium rufum]